MKKTILFSASDIEIATPEAVVGEISFNSRSAWKKAIEIDKLSQIRSDIGAIVPDQTIKFWTEGRWSMHDLLAYLLGESGPAQVMISTWAIGELAARKLHQLRTTGAITKLSLILDYRINERSPKALQLLKSTADQLSITKCHAKVTVIQSDSLCISIVTSANYTRNPRLEAGTIFTSVNDVYFDRNFLTKTLEK